MIEYPIQCPHCWQSITVLLDSSLSETYIEDCEVCCNPMEIRTVFNDRELISCDVNSIGQ